MVSTTPEGVTLGLHIVAGFLALFTGAGALATKKGGRRHRRFGRVYVYAMTFVAGSTLLLYAFGPTFTRLFLGLVAVFSYYFVFSGYRVLGRERPADEPTAVDWAAVALLTLAGLGLLGMGVFLAFEGVGFAIVMLVFGVIGTGMGANEVRNFRRHADEPRAWFTRHLSRMIARYIATVTAFSTVNFTFLPVDVRWLWPTAVGVPAILLLLRKYRTGRAAAA